MPRHGDQRVFVTGGTSGIGEAIVGLFAAEGARVVFSGRDRARGERVAARTGAAFVRADVRDAAAVEASVAEALRRLGGLDTAILNAGVLCEAPLSETSDEQWDTVIGRTSSPRSATRRRSCPRSGMRRLAWCSSHPTPASGARPRSAPTRSRSAR